MMVFVDTSAFYAMLDRDDDNHARAAAQWTALVQQKSPLLTNNYVLVETSALLQHRLGIAALRVFHQDLLPLFAVDWISAERHRSGVEAALAAQRRKLSIVDCISFQTMRDRGAVTAFWFDSHFVEQGFTSLP